MERQKCYYETATKIWSGENRDLHYDFDCSIGKIIYTAMKRHPQDVCQISDIDGRAVTSGEALTWAVRIALHLRKMGLGQQDVVGISAKNSTFVMPVAVACIMNTTPFHAVNPILDEETLRHLYKLTKPKVIFCDGEIYDKVRASTSNTKPLIYTLNDHIEGVPKVEDLLKPMENENTFKPERLRLGGAQTMAILCSSGTTGLPKAVCISNYTLKELPFLLTCEDKVYVSSGLDWFTGIITMVISCTIGCTRIISNKPFISEYFVHLAEKYKLSFAIAPPRHLAALLSFLEVTRKKLSSLRSLTSGGGFISVSTLQRLQLVMPNTEISFCYGSTEVGLIASNSDVGKNNSVGQISSGVKVRILNENGENLSYNEVGEICIWNGYKWNGYYNNEMETQRMQDSNGWFYSGDLGYFDTNNNLYVVDRKKDTLKYQGMHYWPTEIEELIAELPQVLDVCVVGIYDESCGDAAGAVIVKRAGSILTEENVKDHVAKNLTAKYKHLHAGVLFVDQLPQNANGKTLKRDTKALLEKALHPRESSIAS